MQKAKIRAEFDVETDQLAWLRQMADDYKLPDVAKALRIVIDHAMMDGDEDDIFMQIRCRRCG
jgi:rRNA maturation endonuclease Nob1